MSVSSFLVLNPRTLQGQTASLYVVGNVTVRPPDTLLTTSVSIAGPSSVGRCGVARFDGYASFGFRSSAQLVEADYAPFWELDGAAGATDALRAVPPRVVYPVQSLNPITAVHHLIRQSGARARACIDELEVFSYDSTLVRQMAGALDTAEGSTANFTANLTTELSNLNLAYQSLITDSCSDPYADPFARSLNATVALSDVANVTDLSLLVDGVYGVVAPWVACNQPQVWVTVQFANPMVVDHITIGNLTQCAPTNLMLFTAQSAYYGFTGSDVDSHVYRQRLTALHMQPDTAHLALVNPPELRALGDATTNGWSPLQLSALDVTNSGASLQVPLQAEVLASPTNGNSTLSLCMKLPSQGYVGCDGVEGKASSDQLLLPLLSPLHAGDSGGAVHQPVDNRERHSALSAQPQLLRDIQRHQKGGGHQRPMRQLPLAHLSDLLHERHHSESDQLHHHH